MADPPDKAVYALDIQTGNSKAQVDGLKVSVDGLVDSNEKLAVSEEKVTKRTKATGDELSRTEAKYSPRLRLEQKLQNEQERMNRLAQEGVGSDQERARVFSIVEAQIRRQIAALDQMSGTMDKSRTSTGLARYELINLGRQVQDVGVSLASGQSPLTVLIQQGTQIADVFVSSRASVGSFFTQAVRGVGGFVASSRGVGTALLAIGAGAAAAAGSWVSAQKDIERALIGIGSASGVTVDDINKIAEKASSATRISTSEAQQAASIFAGTGKIYKENIEKATLATYNFAKATGKDTTEAAKMMATALADPVEGLKTLEKQFGPLDGATREWIGSLQRAGLEQKAIQVLLDAFGPKIEKAAKLTGFWATTWDLVSKYASQAYSAVGKAVSSGTTEEQIAKLTAQRAALVAGATPTPGRMLGPSQAPMSGGEEMRRAAVEALDAALAKLNKTQEENAKLSADDRLRQFAAIADEATRAVIPQIEAIKALQEQLKALKRGQEDTGDTKGGLAASYQEAINAIQLQIRLLNEAREQTARQVVAVTELAAAYGNVSVEVARQADALQQQITVAKAAAGIATIAAQEQATIHQLKQQGRTDEEAILLAGKQRALTEAEISKQARTQLDALNDQLKVSKAKAGAETLAAQEEATTNRLLAEGKSLSEAMALAAAERAQKVAEANKAVDAQLVSIRQGLQMERARMEGTEASAQAAIAYENAIRSGADATHAAALAAATLNANMEKAEIAAENFANSASRASDAIDQAGRASGGIGTLGGTASKGSGVGVILEGKPIFARSMGDPKFEIFFKLVMEREKQQADYLAAAQAAFKESTSPEGLKAAAEKQQQAAEALMQAAKDQAEAARVAAEEARKAGDLRFQNIAAQYIINGIAPLAINAMIESGALMRYDASSTFKTQLDLYRRAGVSSSQTRADILSGIIGEGVAPTELLQALDSLTDAVSSNTDAQIGLSDFYTQQGDRLLGYRGYNVQPAGFPKVNTGTGTGTTATGTGAMPYGGVVNAGPAGTDLSMGGTLVRVPGTNQWVQTSSYNTYTGLPTAGFTPQPYPTVSGTSTSLYSGGYYHMAEGGVAYGPQYGVFGEAGPEAFVPLRGGAIPVQLMHKPGAAAAADAGPRTIINITAPLVNFMAEPTRDEVRASAYQAGQMMRRMMAA